MPPAPDWDALGRIVATSAAVYAAVILFTRLSGKRTTSQMNNFDWIVTVAIGSIVASTILMKDVPLLQGVTAIAALMLLQFLVTLGAWHLPWMQAVVRAKPTVLMVRGEFCRSDMRSERITESELRAALREKGIVDLNQIGVVILENDAGFSVLQSDALAGELPTEKQSSVCEPAVQQDIRKRVSSGR